MHRKEQTKKRKNPYSYHSLSKQLAGRSFIAAVVASGCFTWKKDDCFIQKQRRKGDNESEWFSGTVAIK